MASALARSHIEAERRLRLLVTGQVERIWGGLPGYDRENVDEWLSRVLPIVAAGQRASVSLTEGYLARALRRPPLGLRPDELIGAAVRNGATPEEVYTRPFVTVWTALGAGTQFPDALGSGLARAQGMAAFDVQASMRATANAVQGADDGIYGYQRVADGDACLFCAEVDGAYVKSADAMALHNNCIVGGSVVWVPTGGGPETTDFRRAHAATRRWYEGEVVVLQTAAGHELTVTPNHPVLTPHDWVEAGRLREGDSVISSSRFDGIGGRVPDEQDRPARIEDRFRAGSVAALASVPFAPEQFHGERGDGEVDVVPLHGGLDDRSLAALLQPREHLPLARRLGASDLFSCQRCFAEGRFRSRSTAYRRVGRRRAGGTLGLGLMGSRKPVLFGGSSFPDASSAQSMIDDTSAYPVALRQGQNTFAREVLPDQGGNRPPSVTRDAASVQSAEDSLFGEADDSRGRLGGFSGEVQLDSLVFVGRRHVAAHVFNLVTSGGWYVADGIVTHNCGCSLEPLTSPHPRAAKLPSGIAVRQHGELGPVLVDPAQTFTSL